MTTFLVSVIIGCILYTAVKEYLRARDKEKL